MNPILYAPGEMSFTSNGLGRLNDIISCEVTEELNTGVYECNFTYPVTGALYDQIQLGCIVAITHDDTGDVQPFDIVGYTRPIDGIVSYHAVHISYRLSHYIAVPGAETVDRLSRVATLFDNAFPHNSEGRFTYHWPGLDEARQYVTATADGLPRSVRQYIGMEGGILDTFDCEVNWNRFIVEFLPRRGQYRNFSIRYGVNLADYSEEADAEETYNCALAYWKKDDTIVKAEVDSGLPATNVGAVALDLTSRFETEPTTAQLAQAATEYMVNGKVNLPTLSIEVDFVHLKDFEEYEGLADLLTVELGDSISVIFPAYNMAGTYRVVKTVWDPLIGKFKSLTLGTLRTTLAQALGTSGGGTTSVGGGGGGSVVVVTPTLTSGTQVGTITVDGVGSTLYAPDPTEVSVSNTLGAGEKIARITVDGAGTDIWGRAPSNDTPLMDGTAAAGGSKAFSRSDHVHPTDTSRQATLVSGTNIKTVNGNSLLGSGDLSVGSGIAGGGGIFYGTSDTPASTVTKTVACNEFTADDLTAGTVIFVKFSHNNTASNPRLVINSQAAAAAPIMRYGSTAAGANTNASWNAGATLCLIFDGTNWNIEGWLNTTYSGITASEYQAGTATTNKLISAANLKAAIAYYAILLADRYTRSSAGDLNWTSTTEGDSKAIMKSALAFWNGAYSGTSSNLRYSNAGQIIGRNQICYANSRVDTFSNGEISIPFANLGITTGARPVGILLTPEYSSDIVMHYMYDNSSSNVVIRAWKAGTAYSGALRYFAVVFQNTWTSV